jgi:CRP/FNR family transcriptional regulator, cyclic AMP receptor protein
VRVRRDAKVEFISRVPLFERCSKRELTALAALADQVELPEGRVLVREGELGREFFVLTDGTAEVRQGRRLLATLGAGDFFGEIALVSNVPRTATVKTVSPVRALVVTSRDFWSLLDESPRTQRKILEAVGDRLARLAPT